MSKKFSLFPSKCRFFLFSLLFCLHSCNQGEQVSAVEGKSVSQQNKNVAFVTVFNGVKGLATLSENAPVVCSHKKTSKVIKSVSLDLPLGAGNILFQEADKKPMALKCNTVADIQPSALTAISCSSSASQEVNEKSPPQIGGFSFRMQLERIYPVSASGASTGDQASNMQAIAVASLIPAGLTGALSAIFSFGSDQMDCLLSLQSFKSTP